MSELSLCALFQGSVVSDLIERSTEPHQIDERETTQKVCSERLRRLLFKLFVLKQQAAVKVGKPVKQKNNDTLNVRLEMYIVLL